MDLVSDTHTQIKRNNCANSVRGREIYNQSVNFQWAQDQESLFWNRSRSKKKDSDHLWSQYWHWKQIQVSRMYCSLL